MKNKMQIIALSIGVVFPMQASATVEEIEAYCQQLANRAPASDRNEVGRLCISYLIDSIGKVPLREAQMDLERAIEDVLR
ncbi:MAG: hypothetical protein ABF288_12260 [Octadecabacter sp.]